MHCKFVLDTDKTFFSLRICVPVPVKCAHYYTHRHNVLSVTLSLTHVVYIQWRNGGVLVDQCFSEAVICLAPVLLWFGRWDGYPYQPSGQPGMDEMWPWPSAEQDQGITVLYAIPAAQLFLWTCQITRVQPCDQHWHPSSLTFHVQAWLWACIVLTVYSDTKVRSASHVDLTS